MWLLLFLLWAQEPTSIQQAKGHARSAADRSINEMVAVFGQVFLDSPYLEQTLEVPGPERLVVDFSGYDCVTLVEMSWAMARAAKLGDTGRYKQELQRIRYRDGEINGYVSRLHYTTEWAANAEKKGILTNVTADLGGDPIEKRIDFMSTHRSAYPKLKDDDAAHAAIAEMEARHGSPYRGHYIPQDQIEALEAGIQDGDIVAITTDIKGLDVSHMGIALRRGERVHLLHASSLQEKVVISDETLADYVKAGKRTNGIMVFRPLDP